MNKLDVQNAILNAMTPYLDDDQLYQLKNTLEETRLSVGKRTKICVKKNENLCQKFCAATVCTIFLFYYIQNWTCKKSSYSILFHLRQSVLICNNDHIWMKS